MKICYYKNKNLYFEKNKRYLERLKEWWLELKEELKCNRCDESHIACIEFHHLDPDKKDFNLGQYQSRSKKKILEEIEKCEILCSNCHRKEHWNQ